eukprot:c14865_g1_i1 orf=168-1439(+)
MPKDKRSGQSALQKSRRRPYKARGKGSEGDSGGERDRRRDDWEDALCPICLESPHNAVLLMCSSHANGCRPYMCNTSDRHSNCLHQYQKTQFDLQKLQSPVQAVSNGEEHPQPLVGDSLNSGDTLNLRIADTYPAAPTRRPLRGSSSSLENALEDTDLETELIEALNLRITSLNAAIATRRSRRNSHQPRLARHETEAAEMHSLDLETGSEGEGLEEESSSTEEHTTLSSSLKSNHLVCPLCRGQIFGWRVITAARKYFNDKARSCSHESCVFAGTYSELRMHARCEHSFSRPCDIDPARQQDWLRMERQREIGDVLSTFRIANEDTSSDHWRWWSYLFLLHIFGPTTPLGNEESIISRIQDYHETRSRRAGSARLREFVEHMQRASDGTNSANGSQLLAGEQMTGSMQPVPRRQRSHRRNQS